jgi:hypothetical protein
MILSHDFSFSFHTLKLLHQGMTWCILKNEGKIFEEKFKCKNYMKISFLFLFWLKMNEYEISIYVSIARIGSLLNKK